MVFKPKAIYQLEEMSEEEVDISRSTPGARFDMPPPPPPASSKPAPAVEITEEDRAFVQKVTHDTQQPVVMFAMEWCEFCWSARKMFAKYKIDYRSVDLDSVEYQEDNQGGRIRAALTEETDSKTIPQIFVGGKFIGGATEIFDACKDGSLQKMLVDCGASFDDSVTTDPYSFLPTWLHPR